MSEHVSHIDCFPTHRVRYVGTQDRPIVEGGVQLRDMNPQREFLFCEITGSMVPKELVDQHVAWVNRIIETEVLLLELTQLTRDGFKKISDKG